MAQEGFINFNLNCWYDHPSVPCPNKTDRCKKMCHLYLEMCYMITNCGMPNAERYIKPIAPATCDLPAYKELQLIKDDIKNFVENGGNLYITSENCGNGKTTWALKLLYKYFDQVWSGNGFKIRGYFLYTPDFLNMMKFPSMYSPTEIKRLNNIVKNCDLVIWDDIAVSQLTQAEHNHFLSFIDYRLQRGKSNIYTGNCLGETLVKNVGQRLADRMENGSKVIVFNGQSMRDII